MSDFVETLTRLEHEVRDLKTAHRRPLGTVEFNRTSIQVPLSQFKNSFGAYSGKVIMTSLDGAPIPTFHIVAHRILGLNGMQNLIDDISHNSDYSQFVYDLYITDVQAKGVSDSSVMEFTVISGGKVALSYQAGA